jgi:hypothetical protein
VAKDKTTTAPWWETEGIREEGVSHEPVAFIVRRGGGPSYEDAVADKRRRYSAATARELARRGVNLVEMQFFKGLGLKEEAAEIRRVKRFIDQCHALGLKVAPYTQWGTYFYETLYAEEPELRGTEQVDFTGTPIEYYDSFRSQYFRYRGCPSQPKFVEFIKRMVKWGIENLGLDVVYFDNLCVFEYHDSLCYCSECRRQFVEFIQERYPTAASRRRRFGISRLDDVRLPPFRAWHEYVEHANMIRDPVIQEFIEFRCETLAKAHREVYQYIKSFGAHLTMLDNPSFPRPYNEKLIGAIDMWRLKDSGHIHYMENPNFSRIDEHGTLHSNIRGYRYGRALGKVMIGYGAPDPRLDRAEALAFNNGDGAGGPNCRDLVEFFLTHRDFYRGVSRGANEVAVLRHDTSLTLDWHAAFTVLELFQQHLICGRIGWDALFQQQLDALPNYRVLVVPGCATMDQAELDAIIAFVRKGGAVVIAEKAGTHDQWAHPRRQWGFAPLFAEAEGGPITQPLAEAGPRRALFGRGRAVYLPQIRATREPVRTYEEIGGYRGQLHIRLPQGWEKVLDEVRWAAGGSMALDLIAPYGVTYEFLSKGKERFLHLVNYTGRPSGLMTVSLDPARLNVRHIDVHSSEPGVSGARALETIHGRRAFLVPSINHYAVVRMR